MSGNSEIKASVALFLSTFFDITHTRNLDRILNQSILTVLYALWVGVTVAHNVIKIMLHGWYSDNCYDYPKWHRYSGMKMCCHKLNEYSEHYELNLSGFYCLFAFFSFCVFVPNRWSFSWVYVLNFILIDTFLTD